MPTQVLIEPRSFLGPRFLQLDGAGVVVDRIEEQGVARLGAWFRSPHGARGGRAFMYRFPVLDAWLHAVQPPIPPSQEGHGFIVGGLNLVAGLAVGSWAVDQYRGGSPFCEFPDLDQVAGVLDAERWSTQDLTSEPAPQVAGELVLAFQGLVGLDPRLDLVHRALFNMAVEALTPLQRRQERMPWPLLFFHAGLIGAGATLPAEGRRSARSRRRSAVPSEGGPSRDELDLD